MTEFYIQELGIGDREKVSIHNYQIEVDIYSTTLLYHDFI